VRQLLLDEARPGPAAYPAPGSRWRSAPRSAAACLLPVGSEAMGKAEVILHAQNVINLSAQHGAARPMTLPEPSRAECGLSAWCTSGRCMPGRCMPGHQTWRAEVARCNEVEKTLRIVVTSGLVNQARFTKGIRESLAAPLERARPPRDAAPRPPPPAPRGYRRSPVPPCGRWE